MIGRLIFVSGVSGAGKTTLTKEALENVPNLKYLKTHTTRPQRKNEEASHEYIFVSPQKYASLKKQNPQWNHTGYNGFDYGADVSEIKQLLNKGVNIICSVVPDQEVIDEMSQLYGTKAITIWLDTPGETAVRRIKKDRLRHLRSEKINLAESSDYIFNPKGVLKEDKRLFIELILRIIT
jgi:guanylate kinase